MILPCPLQPLAQHVGFGQNWSDGSIGSDVLVCIDTACRRIFQAFPPLSPLSGTLLTQGRALPRCVAVACSCPDSSCSIGSAHLLSFEEKSAVNKVPIVPFAKRLVPAHRTGEYSWWGRTSQFRREAPHCLLLLRGALMPKQRYQLRSVRGR